MVGRVSFDVSPSRSGNIECGDIVTPLERTFYLDSGISCSAIPAKEFEFHSWAINLGKNATQVINVSKSATPLESMLELFNITSAESEAALKATKFGSYTANFKELPSPIPSEYWIPLYGIIASTIIGWSIPSIIGWTRSKADVRKLDHYHQRIKALYNDGKLDENDIESLDELKIDITNSYSKGKINDKHYERLKNEISLLYDKMFRKKIDSLKESSNGSKSEQLNKLENDIENAYSEEKLTEMHYNLLNKKIQEVDDKVNKK